MAPTGLHIVSFSAWTVGVACLTWVICTRGIKKSDNAADEYFLGGRALSWYVVAGSLMLTNLSTEQLVGLNGAVFADGCLAGSAWETFAALAMCVTASVFLPRYIKSGLCTTTGFLGTRFDLSTRTLVSVVFLIFYAVGLCPTVLYSGALAIRSIFSMEEVPLWMVSTAIGLIGACYAIFGGLKAVAVSDCLNGIGLLVVGIGVPMAALSKVGGMHGLFEDPMLLRPLVATSEVFDDMTSKRSLSAPSVPWHTLLTGMMMQQLYYWSTNQLIVQRALAARSLSEGQKGVLFAAAMKVVGFIILCIPGILGALMVRQGVVIDGAPFIVKKSDAIYPLVVKAVMPEWSLGLFVAVLLGSILSTFNSALNSAATLFGLEIYKIYINPEASDARVVRMASVFAVMLSLFSFIIAPRLESVASIFDFLQRAKTIASLPIITVFVLGIATKAPDAFAAKAGFVVGAIAYGAGQFLEQPHYLHVFFICFLLSGATILAATYTPWLRSRFKLRTPPEPYVAEVSAYVDVASWPYLYPVIAAIVALVLWLTLSLQLGSLAMVVVFSAAWVITIAALMAFPTIASNPQDLQSNAGLKEDAEAMNSASQELYSAPVRDRCAPPVKEAAGLSPDAVVLGIHSEGIVNENVEIAYKTAGVASQASIEQASILDPKEAMDEPVVTLCKPSSSHLRVSSLSCLFCAILNVRQ